MRIVRSITSCLLFTIFLTGCLYVDVKAPYDLDLNQTELGSKIGESHMRSVLWLFAWGDAGTAAAAKEGGLTSVNHMDRKVFSVLFGLYSKTTTIVYGN